MEQRKLGDGPLVGALGFGCMGMSEFYGVTDDEQSLATLEHAFELGVTLFDTADSARLERLNVSAPIAFVVLGLLVVA